MFSWLNPTRIRVYPRLIAGTMSVVLLLNVMLGHGWVGAFGQIIGGDFITLYSYGVLFRQDSSRLYDFELQSQVQHTLIAPTTMWGFMPFNYPPYFAIPMSWLSNLPLNSALVFWVGFSLAATILSAFLITRDLLPLKLTKSSLSTQQLFIVIFSSLAYIEGLFMGQNHAFNLLFVTAATAFSLRRQWLVAGIFCGFLLYKPHFALGFLIIWFVWQRWAALLGFGVVAAVWVGGFYLRYGWPLFAQYLSNIPMFLKLEYVEGFGGDLGLTPYGLLVDLLPQSAWPGIVILLQVLLVTATLGLAYYAYRQRGLQEYDRLYAYILAVFYPLLVSPHVLLHDLIIIVPALALWARLWPDRKLLYIVVLIYLATFALPLLAHYLEFAVFAFIPLGLTGLLVFQITHQSINKQTEIIV